MADEIKTIIAIEANLSKVQSSLGTLEGNFKSSFGRIERIASGALGAFGVGLGVGSIVAYGKHLLDLGDQLSDLHDQTGLSIAVLGGIKPVLDASNSSLDGFAKGVNKAQAQLGDLNGEGKQAAEAMKAIGLNARELANVSPDEFLEKLVAALAKVENSNERLAISKRILGKAAAELIPTINKLADEGMRKLSAEAVAGFKALGDLKDKMVEITGTSANFWAAVIGKFAGGGLSETRQFIHQLSEERKSLVEEIANLRKTTDGNAGMVGSSLPGSSASRYLELQKQKEARLKAVNGMIEKQLLLEGLPSSTKPAPSKGLLPGGAGGADKVDKLAQALESYRQTLIRTIVQSEIEIVKLKLGDEAALEAAQAYEALGFKAKLAADGLVIPPEVEESARNATAVLKAMGADVATLGETNLVKLQQGALQTADSVNILKASLEDGLKVVQAFADAANEGVGIQAQTTTPQQAAQLKNAKDQIAELRRQLEIDSIDTSTPAGAESKRVAQIHADFAKTTQMIEELGRQAQLSNEESAALRVMAWEKALLQIQDKTDDASEFMRRAFERGFDAVSDGLKDILDNGFKGINDLGEKVRKTLNSLAADFFTLQIKKGFLGEDFGKPGAAIGGWLGDILGTKKTPLPTGFGQRPAGVEGPLLPGGFFSNPAGMAKSATDQAAIVAIQTQGATTEGAIQALSATAQSGLQTSAATIQTGITSLETTAIGSIKAVEAVAIAAIQANSVGGAGAGGGGLLGGLFGGGGGEVGYGGTTLIDDVFSFLHDGGPLSKRGESASFTNALSANLKPNEGLFIGEEGEFVMNKRSTARYGLRALETLNRFHDGGAITIGAGRSIAERGATMGNLPSSMPEKEDGKRGAGENHFHIQFNGVTDMNSFRKSESQYMADLAAAVARGQKYR